MRKFESERRIIERGRKEVGQVAIVRGEHRTENLELALGLLGEEILCSIDAKGSDTLFVKLNAIDSNFPLACTNPLALESVLTWFAPHFKRIIVGDNTFVFSKSRDSHPYTNLKCRLPHTVFSDLTEFPVRYMAFRGPRETTTQIPYSVLPIEAFTVSLSLPKTHDAVTFTATSKNMFGCTLKNRLAMHAISPIRRISIAALVRSNSYIHRNLSAVIRNSRADLAILDAFEGMEGPGPIFGSSVPLNLAIVGHDSIAVDTITSALVGLPLPEYLQLCGETGIGCCRLSDIFIVKRGFDSLEEIMRRFRPHYLQQYQLMREWHRPLVPKIDLRLPLAYARRFHRLVDKMGEAWGQNQ